MDYPNKEIKTGRAAKAPKGVEVAAGPELQDFVFPHYPAPIKVQAKDIVEAEAKFAEIISKEK